MLAALWGRGFLCAGQQLLERSTACRAGTQPCPRAVLTLPSLQGLPQVTFKACEEPSSALKAQKGGKQLRELCVCALEDQRAQSI